MGLAISDEEYPQTHVVKDKPVSSARPQKSKTPRQNRHADKLEDGRGGGSRLCLMRQGSIC